MKRFVVLILTLALLFSGVGCSSSKFDERFVNDTIEILDLIDSYRNRDIQYSDMSSKMNLYIIKISKPRHEE